MIKTHEGLGGWTIKVINGKRETRFECMQYIIVSPGGINWFDWDAAMRDAETLDAAQQLHQADDTCSLCGYDRGRHLSTCANWR